MNYVIRQSFVNTKDNASYVKNKLLPFWLGLSCSTNLVYVLYVGNQKVLISHLISLIIVIIYLFSGDISRDLKLKLSKRIILPMLLFFASILFSGITAVIYFLGKNLIIYFYGLVELLAYLLITVATILCYENKEKIINGFACGFIVNIIFAVVSSIQKQAGAVPKIYELFLRFFPQKISGIDAWGKFRPMGLFFESSYFIGFLIISLFLLVPTDKIDKNSWKKFGFIIMSLILIIFSRSGNILVLFACIVCFIFFNSKNTSTKIRKSTFLYGIVCFLSGFMYITFFGGFEILIKALKSAVQGGSIENSVPRWNNIVRIIGVLPNVPLGCGWNMTNTYMMVYQSHLIDLNDKYTRSTSSFLLTLLMEVGLVGAIAYCVLAVNIFITLIEKRSLTQERLGIAIALLAVILLQFLNGVKYFPHFMMVFGLALCEVSKICKPVQE